MFMKAARQQAFLAEQNGDVPIGAVIVMDGQIIAAAGNQIVQNHDPTAHAEMLVIREAATKLREMRLVECDLYVTLEPCPMCAQAIAFARIRRLYFGAYDPKGGGVDHGPQIFTHKTCHHHPEVYGGIEEQECSILLRDFFARKR